MFCGDGEGNHSSEEKIPEKFTDIIIEFKALNNLLKTVPSTVGEDEDDDLAECGSITREFNNKIRSRFFQLLDSLKKHGANLPEYIKFRQQTPNSGTRTNPSVEMSGADRVSVSFEHALENSNGPQSPIEKMNSELYTSYYLPKTNEQYVVKTYTPSQFCPGSEDFLGFDELRGVDEFEADLYGDFDESNPSKYPESAKKSMLTHKGPQNWFSPLDNIREELTRPAAMTGKTDRVSQQFTSKEVLSILDSFAEADNDSWAEEAITTAKREIDDLVQGRERQRIVALESSADSARQRVINLVGFLKKIKYKIPDQIQTRMEIEDSSEFGTKFCYGILLTNEGRFAIAPSESEKPTPDMSNARPASARECMTVLERIKQNLLPEEIRYRIH